MLPVPDSFSYRHNGSDILFGSGSIVDLGQHLSSKGFERPLIVCGNNVGSNEALMGPMTFGLDGLNYRTFDNTTPEKSIETVFDGITAMDEMNADILIGVGGGSSLDIARQMSVIDADGRSLSDINEEAIEGSVKSPAPRKSPTPVITVPTTFAGADMQVGGSIRVLSSAQSPTPHPVRIRGQIRPTAIVYDPELFKTTPKSVLVRSAMNGFNKGIETIYSSCHNSVSDATSVLGLRMFHQSLRKIAQDDYRRLPSAVAGLLLVQFDSEISFIHAIGHGISRQYPVHQGMIHAVITPHALRYIFDNSSARRELIAEGLGINTANSSQEELENLIISEIVDVIEGLGLPNRLRDIENITRDEFDTIADFTLEDALIKNIPSEFTPDQRDIMEILEDAW